MRSVDWWPGTGGGGRILVGTLGSEIYEVTVPARGGGGGSSLSVALPAAPLVQGHCRHPETRRGDVGALAVAPAAVTVGAAGTGSEGGAAGGLGGAGGSGGGPGTDGQSSLYATSGGDGTVRVWDSARRRQVGGSEAGALSG